MIDILLKILSFLISFMLSTMLIRWGIPKLKQDDETKKALPESSTNFTICDYKSTGFWIGFFETLLVFVFVYEGQYSSLAIIIGAKQFVRKEKIEQNPSYYLLGTLINVSVALIFALVAKNLILK